MQNGKKRQLGTVNLKIYKDSKTLMCCLGILPVQLLQFITLHEVNELSLLETLTYYFDRDQEYAISEATKHTITGIEKSSDFTLK